MNRSHSLIKFCIMTTSRSLLNSKVKGQGRMGFCVFFVCMILLEPVGLDSRNVAHALGYPRAVLSLEQGLTFLFVVFM